jgi:hypothetical protein
MCVPDVPGKPVKMEKMPLWVCSPHDIMESKTSERVSMLWRKGVVCGDTLHLGIPSMITNTTFLPAKMPLSNIGLLR